MSPRALVEANYILVAFPERARDRLVAMHLAMVDVRASRQQELGQFDVILLAGHHQRRHAPLLAASSSTAPFSSNSVAIGTLPE